MADIPNLVDVLGMLATAVAVGPVISFLFERFAFFQALSSQERFWLIFVVSLGLPMLAQVLLQSVPSTTWAVLEPYWHSLAYGFLFWSSSQVAHKLFGRYHVIG